MLAVVRTFSQFKPFEIRQTDGKRGSSTALGHRSLRCGGSSTSAGPGSGLVIASERPGGVLSRQLILGDTLDTETIKATYNGGVLTLRVPVVERAKPRKIEIETKVDQQHMVAA